MKKYEWRKKEQKIYLPKTNPVIVDIPEYKYLTINGEGNPNNDFFSEHIAVLYSISYTLKMGLKKNHNQPNDYTDYTVYPLEGNWDLKSNSKKNANNTINKNDLTYKLMIRQPDFIDATLFEESLEIVKRKKPHELLTKVNFEKITEGKCIQMLHVGSFDDEPKTFKVMEEFAKKENLLRVSKAHKEIYISDFRKVTEEKLKTVLRFKVI
ncbi:MAG: GyrI-like domain-containing protein [Polaribacter sp.]|uniref:GyrI-like domain-containing protein n=1 Tax=Polaribacter sp. TaxID=1920175 RepID=UPI003BAF970A